jgi:PTS system beta-glucosides-specific IIC component
MSNSKVMLNDERKKNTILTRILDTIAGIFSPVLQAITGAGMLKAVLAILIAYKLTS